MNSDSASRKILDNSHKMQMQKQMIKACSSAHSSLKLYYVYKAAMTCRLLHKVAINLDNNKPAKQ